MGPIRQAACISFLMISILLIAKKKYYISFFLTIFSLLIHQFSILFNGLILGSLFTTFKNIKLSRKMIFLIVVISLTLLYCLPSMINKVYLYFTLYKKIDQNGTIIIPPAKSAIYIWFINFIPSIIFLKNIPKFKFQNSLNKILTLFSISEFLLLPIVFLNSVIAYRLLLYLFPSSILITSKLPDLNLFKLKSKYILNIIILCCFISLIVWLNFAYHASCWVPYKNIIFY